MTVASHECHGVENQRQLDCFFRQLLRSNNKMNVKHLHFWSFVATTGYQRIPLTKGNNAESVSLPWRHDARWLGNAVLFSGRSHGLLRGICGATICRIPLIRGTVLGNYKPTSSRCVTDSVHPLAGTGPALQLISILPRGRTTGKWESGTKYEWWHVRCPRPNHRPCFYQSGSTSSLD